VKNWGIVALSLLVLCVLAYGVWVQFPLVNHPQRTNQAMIEVALRYRTLQREAADPAVNGYLAPEFLPYWAGLGKGNPNNSVQPVIDRWLKYCPQSYLEQDATDQAKLLASGDTEYLVAKKGISQLLRRVYPELEKPFFLDPQASLDELINMIALKNLVAASNGYAQALMAEGEYDQAFEMLRLPFLVGGHWRARDSDTMLFGFTFQTLGLEALVGLWDRNSKPNPDALLALSRTITETMPQDVHLVEAAEQEMVEAVATVKAYAKNPSVLATQAQLMSGLGSGTPAHFYHILRLPGQLSREERILMNLFDKRFPSGSHKTSFSQLINLSSNNTELTSWILGEHPLLSEGLDFSPRLVALIYSHRAKMTASATVLGLFAYKQKYGQFPQKLEELGTLGLVEAEGFEWKTLKYDPAQELRVPYEAAIDISLLRVQKNSFTAKPWLVTTQDGILVRLSD
jgi:hypothetical protein